MLGKIGFFFLCLIILSKAAFAGDSIVVKKDPRFDILTQKQVSINKRSSMMTSTGMYKGFRIQVVSTNKRDDAFKIKAELLTRFPGEKVYVLFQSPAFRVRIGNFLKRQDAEKFRAQLTKLYPQGCYIVEDGIEYTPPNEDDATGQ